MSSRNRSSRWIAAAVAPIVPLLLFATPVVAPVEAATGTVNCRANPAALGPALAAAAAGDTVRFSGTCLGTFTIDKDLTLEGSGLAVLDGEGARIVLGLNFDPQTGPLGFPHPTIRVVGVTVTGGSEAGIGNWAETELENVTVRDNSGDGIFTHAGSLTLRRSVVRDNGNDGIGSMSVVRLENSTVSGNVRRGVTGGSSINVVGSTIEGNGDRGVGSSDQTGIVVERSVVRRNLGGGISAGGNSALIVTDSTVTGNSTDGDGGGIRAGGVLLAAFRISGTTVTGNTAAGDGGGIWTSGTSAEDFIEGSTIRGNTAGGRGGGIFNGQDPFDESGSAVLTVRRSTVTGNVADAGGGIYNEGAVVLEGTRVKGNRPDDCAGC